MKIKGRNAVLEAIKSGATVDKLLVQKGLFDGHSQRVIDAAKQTGIKPFFYDKSVLDSEGGAGHQGFVAVVTDYKYYQLEDLIFGADKNALILILDGIEDPHNLGSVLRVAECAGAAGVIIPRHKSASVTETVIKVSAGAAAHVRVAKVVNIAQSIEQLKKEGFFVYAAELGGDDVYKTDLSGRTAIVIGGEDKGVGTRIKSVCDKVVTIPLKGSVNSLNASVAAGIVVFEKMRQEKIS